MPETNPPSLAPDGRFVARLSLMILLPIVLGAILFTSVLSNFAHNKLEDQGRILGQAIVDQLAFSLTDHLVSEDILSLNVILSDLLRRGNFDFASVYSADNRLLAQAGRRGREDEQVVFTRDVTFQNATAGYVQIGFERERLYAAPSLMAAISLVLHTGVAALAVFLVFNRRRQIHEWLFAPAESSDVAQMEDQQADSVPAEINTDETEIKNVCVLVIRIRPVRLIETWRTRIGKALSLYGGVITNSEGDDISAVFSTRDQVFQAICGGLLVKSMVNRIGPPVKFNAGIHNAPANDSSVARKHASYLASITENLLLTSHRVYNEVADNDKVVMQEFHSSLTPDGEVYSAISLSQSNQALIEKQSRQLL